jgi:hypothetical protein
MCINLTWVLSDLTRPDTLGMRGSAINISCKGVHYEISGGPGPNRGVANHLVYPTYVYIYIYMYSYLYLYIYVYIYKYIYMYIHIYIYIYIHIYKYVYMHVCINTFGKDIISI